MSRKSVSKVSGNSYSLGAKTLLQTCPIPFKDDWRYFMEEIVHLGPTRIEDLYDLYCQYAEASRAAVLSVTLSRESRRRISAENPCISREEFQRSLNSMTEKTRGGFIRHLTIGYEAARSESFPSLKAKFEQMMLPPVKGA